MGEPKTIHLADGRALEVWVEGPVDGTPLVYHHGTPSSGLPFGPWLEEAGRRRIRFVSYSRPGYGASDRKEGRSVADCAADVDEILDRLGLGRCHTLGWSGGGPHALACAALLPDRVAAAGTIAGVGPYGADGLDYLAGMGRENIEEFGAALEGPEALGAWMKENAPPFAALTAEEVVDALGDLVSEVDRGSVTSAFCSFLAEENRHALRDVWWGWYDDDLAFIHPWGFDLGAIRVPVAIWQGPHDRMVPFAHGEWLAANVAGAHGRLRPEHGHLSLAVGGFGEILDDLGSLAGE
jgi:pimeloyl-ACP methyl ester carboxylesterase